MPLILALVQVTLAIVWRISDYFRPIHRYLWGMPADREFSVALNAPVTLIRAYLAFFVGRSYPQYYHLTVLFVFDDVVYFVLVALLWYAVGVEITGRGWSVLTSRTRLRSIADGLAFLYGGALLYAGAMIARGKYGFVVSHPHLVAPLFFVWGLTIAAFYGHDLWVTLDAAKEGQPSN